MKLKRLTEYRGIVSVNGGDVWTNAGFRELTKQHFGYKTGIK